MSVDTGELKEMNTNLYIVGAGTYGEAMCELAEILGYTVIGFFDEDESKHGISVMNHPVLGKFSGLDGIEIKGRNFIVAIGNNAARFAIMTRINNSGGHTPTLIHPTATISPSAEIGKGVYIQANALIWTKVNVSDYCIISPNVVIAHHSSIGTACLISTLTGVGASIRIEDKAFIGMGCTIVTGVSRIGTNSVVGAGAVVIKDLPDNCTAIGVPARPI